MLFSMKKLTLTFVLLHEVRAAAEDLKELQLFSDLFPDYDGNQYKKSEIDKWLEQQTVPNYSDQQWQ